MKKYIFLGLMLLVSISACRKTEPFDAAAQLAKEELLIQEFIKTNNLPAERDQSGVYYIVIQPGQGNVTYTTRTVVDVSYTGRLLNGTVFDKGSFGINQGITLGNLIPGWAYGIRHIQPGGKIRLLIPSVHAYGRQAKSGIPANSVLDFDIDLHAALNN